VAQYWLQIVAHFALQFNTLCNFPAKTVKFTFSQIILHMKVRR